MNLAKGLASVGITMIVGFTVPLAWGQAIEPGVAGSTPAAPAAISPIVPAERVAPGVPGIPPNAPRPLGLAPGGSRVDAMKMDYSAKKNVAAQTQGRNRTTAESQEATGKAQSKTPIRDEAAQHLEAPLHSIGVMPIGLDQDAGESNSENQRTRDAN
jgi:hypothetical protein